MNVTFFDLEDQANDLNGTAFQGSKILLGVLERLRTRSPFVCELVGENGFQLHVGIGHNGHAQYSRRDGEPPYLMAVAPHPEQEDEDTEFLLGGTPTPISNRYCMPFDAVREIAAHFLETGRTHPAFAWESI